MSPVLTGDIMVLVQQVAAAAYMKKPTGTEPNQ